MKLASIAASERTFSRACREYRHPHNRPGPRRSHVPFQERVGFQNSAMASDQRFQAAGSYWLISPPRTGRRRILPQDRLGDRRFRARWTQLQGSMRPLRVVVRGVLGQHPAEVPLPEDQHPVGDLGPDGQHEAFGEAVRPRAPRRDLDHLDARIGQHRVERGRELSGPIADEEPEPARRARRGPSRGCGPAGWSRARRDARSRPGRAGSGRRPRARTGRRAAAASPRSRRGRSRRPACWWPGCAGTAASWCRCAGPALVGSGGAAGSAGSSRRRRGGRV